jgi:hypothetical protein
MTEESKFDKIFQEAREPSKPETAPATPLSHAAANKRSMSKAPKGRSSTIRPTGDPLPPRAFGRPPGKRSDPAWKQYSLLLKKETQRKAAALLRDQDEGLDLSVLVQNLLENWVKRQKS